MTFAGIAVLIRFEQFRVFFSIIQLANFRSVKIVQKSGNIQGIFQLLMSSKPVDTMFIFFILLTLRPGNNHITSSKPT